MFCLNMLNVFLSVLLLVLLHSAIISAQEDEKANVFAQRITKMLSPRNKALLKRGFRSDTIMNKEEKIAESMWNIIKELPCKQGYSDFGKIYKESFDVVVALFTGLETSKEISNSLETFSNIFQYLLSFIEKNEQEKVNESLVVSAVLRVISERNDTRNVHIDPSKIFPQLNTYNALNSPVFRQASTENVPWEALPTTPSRVQEPESRLDYFREDESLHMFHRNWHSINFASFSSPRRRPFEHFYYLHRLFVYRYITERDTVGIPEITPLDANARRGSFSTFYSITPINDPQRVLSNRYSSNVDFCRLPPQVYSRIDSAESECFRSLNRGDGLEAYGSNCDFYHNVGHNSIGDQCKSGNQLGLMGFSDVSARDPIFYRWHTEIDIKYDLYLRRQRGYTSRELFPPRGIYVIDVYLRSRCRDVNKVETFWELTDSQYRLNHMDFRFEIRFWNALRLRNKVILRIFLVKEKFVNIHRHYFELDRFTYRLTGNRLESLTRFSNQSSIIWRNNAQCGWPPNLLLPKGGQFTPESYRIIVFINDVSNQAVNEGESDEPTIPCGSPNVFMDSRPFGWPVDKDWIGLNKMNVINNRYRVFGRISQRIEIMNRGFNPSICDDARFTREGLSMVMP
ncbi:hemocyanin AA6 chain isoform X2 [Eurytemora carolleeae]|uniref:hemocyanin AA6 chain isoform X2 n=1 Tax=Eurytemora carolleeae TaxID=1294199 RepID=UPI000C7934A8|nr:hemocyanin AA6 chain isoform X2 [Eurytemora carolleeae]|eukprot:XP_023320583.1 hemocyanin AA6 chain-like isoform X2 [Eurytemora affinis]